MAWAEADAGAASARSSDNRTAVRRMLTPGIVLALVLAAPAAAHVTVEPGSVKPGADVRVAFTVPNEERGAAILGFTVRIPEGFAAEAVEAKPGWRVSREGSTVRWSGGAIAPGRFETFALTGSARRGGSLAFRAWERLPGRVLAYTPTVTARAAAARPAGRDSGARTLAGAALAVAIAGAVAGAGAFFFALALWLRGAGRLSES